MEQNTRKPAMISFALSGEEYEALYQSSVRNLRNPKDEARSLLRQALNIDGNNLQKQIDELEKRVAELEGKGVRGVSHER